MYYCARVSVLLIYVIFPLKDIVDGQQGLTILVTTYGHENNHLPRYFAQARVSGTYRTLQCGRLAVGDRTGHQARLYLGVVKPTGIHAGVLSIHSCMGRLKWFFERHHPLKRFRAAPRKFCCGFPAGKFRGSYFIRDRLCNAMSLRRRPRQT